MNSKKHKLPRRILAMLLAICMFVTMFPAGAFAVDTQDRRPRGENAYFYVLKSDYSGTLSDATKGDFYYVGQGRVDRDVEAVFDATGVAVNDLIETLPEYSHSQLRQLGVDDSFIDKLGNEFSNVTWYRTVLSDGANGNSGYSDPVSSGTKCWHVDATLNPDKENYQVHFYVEEATSPLIAQFTQEVGMSIIDENITNATQAANKSAPDGWHVEWYSDEACEQPITDEEIITASGNQQGGSVLNIYGKYVPTTQDGTLNLQIYLDGQLQTIENAQALQRYLTDVSATGQTDDVTLSYNGEQIGVGYQYETYNAADLQLTINDTYVLQGVSGKFIYGKNGWESVIPDGNMYTVDNVDGSSTLSVYLNTKYTVEYYPETLGSYYEDNNTYITEPALKSAQSPNFGGIGSDFSDDLKNLGIDGSWINSKLETTVNLLEIQQDNYSGWYKTENGNEQHSNSYTHDAIRTAAESSGDETPTVIECYARVNQFTVSYEVTGSERPETIQGTVPEDSKEYQGDSVKVAEALTTTETSKDGVPGTWTFSGWSADGIEVTDGSFTMPGAHVTFTGSWTFTPNAQFTVSYEVTGSERPETIQGTVPEDSKEYQGDSVKVAEALTTTETSKDGVPGTWTFSGWSADGIDVTDGSFTMPGAHVTFTGSWTFTPNAQFTVSYEVTGSERPETIQGTVPEDSKEYQGDSVKVAEALTTTETSKDGVPGTWTFSGWSADGIDVTDGSFTMPGAHVTFTGSWIFTPNAQFTVSYEVTGSERPETIQGTVPEDSKEYQGDSVKVAEALTTTETSKDGVPGTWTFSGWSADGIEVTDGSFTMPGAHVTFTGSWTFTPNAQFTVSYEVTGSERPETVQGTVPEVSEEYQGDSVKVAEALTTTETSKDGVPETWTFSGWSADGIDVTDGSFTMPGAHVTFTGSWIFTPNAQFTVSYEVTGSERPETIQGTVPEDSKEYQGDSVKVAEALTTTETSKDGVPGTWTFSGWSADGIEVTDGSFTMPGAHVTFTGSWTFTPNAQFTVSYEVTGSERPETIQGTVPEDSKEYQGDSVKVAEALTTTETSKDGVPGTWTFSGWSADGIEVTDGSFTMPGAHVTFTGSWTFTPNAYTLVYDANGGSFGDKESVSVTNLSAEQEYDLWSAEDDTQPVDTKLPSHGTDSETGADVVFIGWTDDSSAQGKIYAAGQAYPYDTTVTIPADAENNTMTVYAVWGYDTNGDGIADATQVFITPADITAYTGGQDYSGVVDADGNIIEDLETNAGLPEPGYFITLPYDAQQWVNEQEGGNATAANLSKYLTFTYSGSVEGQTDTTTREWGLVSQGNYDATRYVYSLTAGVVDGDENNTIPVRLSYFTDSNGDGKPSSNEILDESIIMTEDSVCNTFSMTINSGGLNQGEIKATFNASTETTVTDGPEYSVAVGTGTLTVKSVVNQDTTNTNAIVSDANSVDTNVQTAVADDSVQYYVNDSEVKVPVANDRVQLLVDSVSNNNDFNDQMGQHAIDFVDGNSDTHSYKLVYMDLVDTENGNTQVTLGDNDELTIYWPMPEDANENGEFHVVHYTGMDRTDVVTDLNAENPEQLDVTPVTINNQTYLTFSVGSFSPFALVYETDNGGSDTPDNPGWTPGGGDDGPDGLNTEDHFSYIVGYAEDYRTGEPTDNEDLWPVKPNNQITRAEVATIFYRLLEDEVRDEYDTTVNDFSDVSADSWYNQTVSTLASMGIVKGYEDGTFRPNAPITRAEFGAIATRFFAETGATYEPGTFSDVTGDEWYANAIQDAVNLGLIGGYEDGTVRPNNNITRAEACAIVNRTLGRVPDADHLLPDDVMKTWPDNPESAWFYADMQEATNGHEYSWITEDGNEVEEWTDILDKDWNDR